MTIETAFSTQIIIQLEGVSHRFFISLFAISIVP